LEVQDRFPSLQAVKYRTIATGWENLVLEINEEYIFRFPLFRGGWTRIQEEMVLLPWLSRELTFAVPNYEYIWPGSRRHPERFAGYRRIHGIPCTKGVFRKKWTTRLGGDLGHFITELHNVRPPLTASSSIPKYNPKTWAGLREKFYRRVRKLAYPLLDVQTRRKAEIFWEASLDQFSKANFEPVLIHSDLRGGNTIFDPKTGGLTGIIDWGHVAVADPALDFMGSFEINRHLGERALESYGRGTSGFLERIELYLKTVPFGEIVWGVQTGALRFTRMGLKHIRQQLI
jgi:aminoglycoside 2''-phosphotransferase